MAAVSDHRAGRRASRSPRGSSSRWLKPDGVGRQGGRAALRAGDRQGDATSSPPRPSGVLKITVAEGETVAIGAVVGDDRPRRPGVRRRGRRRRRSRAAAEPRPPPTAQASPPPRPPPSRRRRRRRPVARRPPDRRRGGRRPRPGRRRPAAAVGSPRRTCWRTWRRRPRRPAPPRRRRPGAAPPRAAGIADGPRETRQRDERRSASGSPSGCVEAQQTAAILTTFNEATCRRVMELRAQYKDAFEKKHGVGARLHVVLRQGGGRGAEGVPGGQRPDRRQRHRLPALLRHRRRRQHRAGADGPGPPRRRPAELRRDREGDRRAGRARPATARSASPTSRAAPSRSPTAASSARCSRRRSSTRRRAASSACTRSRSGRSSSTTRSSSAR